MAKQPKSGEGSGSETGPTDAKAPAKESANAAPGTEVVPASGMTATQNGGSANVPAAAQSRAMSAPSHSAYKDREAVVGDDMTDAQYAAMMNQIDGAIDENIELGEIKVSRISIAQPGTPQVASNQQGWKGGMLFSNLTNEFLSHAGKSPWLIAKGLEPSEIRTQEYCNFVPIFRLPTEYCKWPNKEEREAGMKRFHWKTLNKNEPRVREGIWENRGGTFNGKGAPPVTEHLNVLGIVLNDDGTPMSGLVVASFSRTSFPTGELLVTNCKEQKMTGLPFWGRVYHLYTESTTNDQRQTYYVLQFAKGKELLKFGDPDMMKAVNRMCMKTAFDLSDPVNGKKLQELYINAAGMADNVDDAGGDDLDPMGDNDGAVGSATNGADPKF